MRGWFADTDEEHGNDWQPVLQIPPVCLPLPIWFDTETACEQFIREEILPARVLADMCRRRV